MLRARARRVVVVFQVARWWVRRSSRRAARWDIVVRVCGVEVKGNRVVEGRVADAVLGYTVSHFVRRNNWDVPHRVHQG